ncbi:tRNA (adenosine(37)-N6)-threonylcarbamoyltransferase complex ATPase subunit type 1 TsaE [Gluconacetobacter tumulisoli]|uniref:tRNA threonylcarbamoyladenosine biosynthesis protein TsaE n=1 Tax=Gluconacetobacter tumulisoli TaxID=1286189 RepID=A0A7W4PLA7_9PROT|nr:tRNA (adenosine(37)-N6)-threonylcarbamoyltransferase complex ATPase subunit type 1 TsaE [Gluconacetobacter tumulisoli]MBB2200439.1 tRNA (adenosine(37)-N6)-threonylcarbamoyltransferase complex ATPase subunit type 1 TsaE [Gluconacetobacter tumulisoli]
MEPLVAQDARLNPLIVPLPDQQATEDLARAVAGAASAGDAILLSGVLGAGKTVFSRAFLRAACGDPDMEVPSPSYTLVQTYDAPSGAISHFDLWRLDGPDALHELGWDDACEGIVLVEWPDRLAELTPPGALRIEIRILDEGGRQARLAGWGDRPVTAALAAARDGGRQGG